MVAIEIIPYFTAKEKLKLLRMNNRYKTEATEAYENYIIIKREVGQSYDDRQRKY